MLMAARVLQGRRLAHAAAMSLSTGCALLGCGQHGWGCQLRLSQRPI